MPEKRTVKALELPPSKDAYAPEMDVGERRLRQLMATEVGVIRTGSGLARALAEIVVIEKGAQSKALRDMATATLMIAAAAYARTESRGAHFRSDFPQADPAQAKRSYFTLEQARAIAQRAAAKAA
jgi:L-aspartate oxidase